ncbi:major facilitator superfamily domain-containing protein 1-like isoform X2 [Mizuhopecten yessoensis]|uniref:major facilitator superfamily domain-containing protein 1-like isoform X2 n=1 Tax=Mizuhopecten yessoensis TaxID=6573 RepID=UPI000B45D020|nr:major facilitator superfamily domain-containing protein 1-like isoform X2 [Mizuhopecten yessoensis]
MDVTEWKTRYVLLVFACFLPFGCYFNIDVPGALQKDLQGVHTKNCTNLTTNTTNTTCCSDCLGLGPDRYNQLYAAYSWMNAVNALPGGYFIDRIGNRGSAILTTMVASVGSVLFAVSVTDSIRGTSVMFPLMFCGRLLLGAGTGPALIVQNRMLASWFPDNILLVFSLMVVVLRLGNVSNFFLTANIANWIGLSTTLWIAAAICCISIVCAVVVSLLDYYGQSRVKVEMKVAQRSNFVTLREIRLLPKTFWLYSVVIMSFYACYLPLIGNGSKYIQDRYGYSKTTASYYNGAVYDVSVLISPVMGVILRRLNITGIVMSCCAVLTVPVFPLFSFCPEIHPLILTIYLGTTYTVFAICLWPSVSVLVSPEVFGTAQGITICMQGLAVGLTNLGIGKILGVTERQD